MRRRRIACGLLALAALSCAAAPAAAAQPPPSAAQLYAGVARLSERLALMGQGSSSLGLPRGRALSELRFENRDGYTISVTRLRADGRAGRQPRAVPPQGRGERRHRVRERVQETTYLAHGRVTPRSIEASFGDRGRIAVRFQLRAAGRSTPAARPAASGRTARRSPTWAPSTASCASAARGASPRSTPTASPGARSTWERFSPACSASRRRATRALPRADAPLGIRLPGLVARAAAAPSVPAVPTHPSSGPTVDDAGRRPQGSARADRLRRPGSRRRAPPLPRRRPGQRRVARHRPPRLRARRRDRVLLRRRALQRDRQPAAALPRRRRPAARPAQREELERLARRLLPRRAARVADRDAVRRLAVAGLLRPAGRRPLARRR